MGERQQRRAEVVDRLERQHEAVAGQLAPAARERFDDERPRQRRALPQVIARHRR